MTNWSIEIWSNQIGGDQKSVRFNVEGKELLSLEKGEFEMVYVEAEIMYSTNVLCLQ